MYGNNHIMTAEFQLSEPSVPHKPPSFLELMGNDRAVLQFRAAAQPTGDVGDRKLSALLPIDDNIITITDVTLIKKIEDLIHNESLGKNREVQLVPPARSGEKKPSVWLPIDDGIITISDVALIKKVENVIANVLYGSKKILRRLPVFEDITPS